MRRVLGLLASGMLLQGCMFAPGMDFSERDIAKQNYQMIDTPESEWAGIEKVELTVKTVATQGENSPSIPSALLDYKPTEYRLGGRDGISLIVWDHPEITAPSGGGNDKLVRNIDADGNLFVPYAGNLQVAGMTVAEARQLVTQKLSRYIENPQVDLIIGQYVSQRFTVGGEVEQPGVKVLANQPINLLDAIGMAGGFTEQADQTRVTLVRDGVRYTLDFAGLMQKLSADIARVYIKAGDVIQVSDNTSRKAFLVGEVNKPQPVPFTSHGLTLTEALGNASGVSATTGNASKVYVIRARDVANGSIARVYHLDASSPTALVVADEFQLQPRDVVFVGAASITRWNRVISQLLPSASLVNTADNLGSD